MLLSHFLFWFQIEDDPHDQVAVQIIGQFLYGDTKEDFEQRLNSVTARQRLQQEPESFWLELLGLMHDTNVVVVREKCGFDVTRFVWLLETCTIFVFI